MAQPIRHFWAAAIALVACGGYRTIDAPPAPPVPIPVTGRIVDSFGLPVTGLLVAAGTGGHWESTATSDANGAFRLSIADIPYDLAVVQSGYANVYQGLTRTDPTVREQFGGQVPPSGRTGTITGTIAALCSGPGCNTVAQGLVAFEPGPNGTPPLRSAPGAVSFTVRNWWTGADAVSGRLHALTWYGSSLDSALQGYWYGYADVSVAAGGTTTVDLPALQPAATGPLSGTIAAPAGVTVDDIYLAHTLAAEPIYVVVRRAATGSSFQFDIPSAPGIATQVGVGGSSSSGESFGAGRTGALAGTTGLILALQPAAPGLVAPAAGETGIGPGARFAWTPVRGAIHWLSVGPVILASAGGEVTLPDLAALGLSYPAGASATWRVQAMGPYADIDAYLAPPAVSRPRDWWWSASATRAFQFR